MAEDISTLVLQVKSDGIKDGTDQLDALTAAATRAEGAAKKLGTQVVQSGTAAQKASGSAKALAGAQDTATKAVGAATTAYQQKAVEQKREVELLNNSLKAYGQAYTEAMRLNKEIDASAAAYDKMWNSAQRMNAEFDKRAAQKAADDFSKAYDQAIRMNAAFDASVQAYGRLQSKALEMNAAYDAQEAAGNKAAKGHGTNAAAIREVMVLMHELSQGSMKRFGSSLMVLANQWDVIPGIMEKVKAGQFGVIGAWAAGIGMAGLAVGAIGVLIAAYVEAGVQQREFNAGMIQTGNYAGLVASDFHELAIAAAGSDGSIGVAKEAIIALGASGKFTKDQIAAIAESAVLSERAFGTSVQDTAKEYETLATLAVTSTSRSFNVISQHAMALNDHYHFLTSAQFEHIANLEREGKAQQAVAELTDALHKAQDDRAKDAIKGLSAWANGYHELKSAISGAMDELGRKIHPTTDADLLANAKENRALLSKQFATDDAAKNSPDIQAADKEIMRLTNKIIADKAAAVKAGHDQELNELRIHNAEKFRVLAEANDKELLKTRQLSELDNLYNSEDATFKLAHLKEYQTARAKIIADSAPKTPKGFDTRTSDRDGAVQHLQEVNREKLEQIDGFITLTKERYKKEGENRRVALDEITAYYEQEKSVINSNLKQELAIYDAYAKNGKHTPRELSENANKRQNAVDKASVKVTGIDNLENKAKEDVYAAEEQEMDKLEKKKDQYYMAESKRITALVAAEKIRLAGIEDVKSAKISAQATKESDEADQLQHEYDVRMGLIKVMQDTGLWDARRVEIEESGLSALKTEIDGRRELVTLHQKEAVAQKGKEDFAHTTKDLENAIAAGKRFDKELTAAFGNVGKAIGGMSNAFLQMMKDKNDAQASYNSLSQDQQATDAAKAALDAANTDATIKGFGGMAEAAAGFFDKKSKGAQIAEGIAKGFHVAEMARNAVQMVSNLATGASAMFAQSGWGGFAGVAAMAATMAAFGISVAGSKSQGGMSAADMQKQQGTGSVFGDIGTTNSDGTVTYKDKSASIDKSLEVLKSNSNVMLPVNQAMLASLQSIQASMAGLTNLVVQNTGITDGSNMGIQTGTLSRTGGSLNSSLTSGGALAGTAAGLYVGATSGAILGNLGLAIAGPIGMLGGLIIGKIASLWGSTKQNIVDSGLQFGGTVGSMEGGSGFNQYASVDTTKSSWFGLSKSTTNSVQTQGLNSELSQQFGLVFSNLETTLKLAAGSLGKNADDVGKQIENMVIDTTKVSLKGLTGTDLTNAINSVISKTMDQIAEQAFPQMDAFRQVGEGYAQTVMRVASGIQTADAAMKSFGIQAVDYNNIINKQGDVAFEIGKQSIGAAEGLSGVNDIIQSMTGSISDLTTMYSSLLAIRKQMNGVGLNGGALDVNAIQGAGGVSQLGTALSTYQDKYFTDQEKSGIMVANLTQDFSKLGLALPATKQALRDLITATGDSTPAAAQLTGQLLALSGAYSDAVDANATANKTATDAMTSSITALQNFADSLKTFKNSLVLGDLSTLTPTEKYLEAKKQYEDTVSKAMSGDATAQGNVTSIAQSYLQAAQTVFASSPEYSSAFQSVQADMDKLDASTGTQLTADQQQLAVMQAQAAGITTLNDTSKQILTAISSPQIVPQVNAAPVVDLSPVTAALDLVKQAVTAQTEANTQQINSLIAVTYDAQATGATQIADAVTSSAKDTAWVAQTTKTISTER